MAHELNNPLAAIRAYLQDVLMDIPEDSPLKERLVDAERATGRCKRIITDLLTFAREKTSEGTSNLNEVIASTIDTAKREVCRDRIQFTTELTPGLPTVALDPMQIKQILMNLISNASDAMDEGGDISIRTAIDDQNVVIDVKDNGNGMPPEVKAKIFDPFYTTKGPGKGTGLGLAISYNMIKRYNGRIDVDSEIGKGTSFTIVLPPKAK